MDEYARTTSPSSFQLPPTFLDSFFPGYSALRRIILEIFSVDVGILVSLIGTAVAFKAGLRYVLKGVRDFIERFCLCSVDMHEDDEIYLVLMRWFYEKKYAQRARNLKPAGYWWSKMTSSWQDHPGLFKNSQGGRGGAHNGSRVQNFASMKYQVPLGLEPDSGSYHFWYKGHLFNFRLYIKDFQHRDSDIEVQRIQLSCYSISTKPLTDLMEDARTLVYEKKIDANTKLSRPRPGTGDWRRLNSRRSRPLTTVTLNHEEKLRIVQDMNDYLHPSRWKWYSDRGIPYRRGYLLSGPPGTGKTSLTLALAGVFGLPLYVISLADPSLNEAHHAELLENVAQRCIVLLDDIDSAGVVKSRELIKDENSNNNKNNNNKGSNKKPNKQDQGNPKISLSGLLNAIDGASSHEGHILVMTTNYPERLDEALKRPGRIDMHVPFSNATKFQAREIFLRIYTDSKKSDSDNAEKNPAEGSKITRTVEEVCRERSHQVEDLHCPFMDVQELDKLSQKFVDLLPEQVFSPAEVQGYLLFHKSDPFAAVDGMRDWAAAQMKLKMEKVKDSEDPRASELRVKLEETQDCNYYDSEGGNTPPDVISKAKTY